MIELSIVIPVYNTEDYLEECLDSICRQGFENLQVICINDCSTDNSYSILEHYKERYNFIEVYCNASNKGLAYTRNKGMEYAKGVYIMFVDSDDYVAPRTLNKLYDGVRNKSIDVMLFDVKEVGDNKYGDDKRIRKNIYTNSSGIKLFGKLVEHNEMFGSVWGGIFRRKFIESRRLHFIEGILHEDIPFMFAALLNAQQTACLSEVVYCYRQRENSILHKPDYEKLALGLLIGYADMLITWHEYEVQHTDTDECNIYVSKYLKSVVRLLNSRCNHLLREKQEINESILSQFLDDFEISIKPDITDYFSLDRINRMKEREHISLYGAGETAYAVVPLLHEAGIQIDKVYVSDINKNTDYLLGIPVVQFEQIPFQDNMHFIVIAAANKNKKEIIELLNQRGYRGTYLTI